MTLPFNPADDAIIRDHARGLTTQELLQETIARVDIALGSNNSGDLHVANLLLEEVTKREEIDATVRKALNTFHKIATHVVNQTHEQT